MPNYNCEMWHWGIPGMKWGQRRYQNKDGTWTSAGKVRRRGEEGHTRYATREEIDAKKKQVMQGHNAKELYKYKDLFDDKEFSDAYKRLLMEKQVKDLIPKQVSKGEQIVDSTIKWGKKASDLINTASNLYTRFRNFWKVKLIKRFYFWRMVILFYSLADFA